MVRRFGFLACVSLAAVLASPASAPEAKAWGCYHAGFTHYGPYTGFHHYGYTRAYGGDGLYGGYRYGGYGHGLYPYGRLGYGDAYRYGYFRRW
jgi:hypothetical protein